MVAFLGHGNDREVFAYKGVEPEDEVGMADTIVYRGIDESVILSPAAVLAIPP